MPATRDKRRRRTKSEEPKPRRAPAAAARARKPVRGEARPEKEAPHVSSPTAVAAEALRTGLSPKTSRPRLEDSSQEAETMRVGDPDDDALQNEYSGEETPGGSTPTPDQNGVDEIGRAYGLQDEDSGALRSSAEVLTRRDRHRSELIAPKRPPRP